jgi:hypothetical protein
MIWDFEVPLGFELALHQIVADRCCWLRPIAEPDLPRASPPPRDSVVADSGVGFLPRQSTTITLQGAFCCRQVGVLGERRPVNPLARDLPTTMGFGRLLPVDHPTDLGIAVPPWAMTFPWDFPY